MKVPPRAQLVYMPGFPFFSSNDSLSDNNNSFIDTSTYLKVLYTSNRFILKKKEKKRTVIDYYTYASNNPKFQYILTNGNETSTLEEVKKEKT